MGWANDQIALLIISAPSGSFSGLFVYSPSPGAGNLIASISAGAGTDPFGNAYQQGIVSYLGTTVAQVFSGSYRLFSTNFTPANAARLTLAGAGVADQSILLTTGNVSTDVPTALLMDSSTGQAALAHAATVIPATATLLEVQGTMALKNATAPAAVVGNAEPFSNSGNLLFVNGLAGDGNTYDTGIRHVDLPSTSIVAVNPAFTAIGVAVPVGIGKYKVHVQGRYTGAAAAVPRFGFTTPTTSAADGDAMFMSNTAANTCQGSITTTWTGPTMNATVLVLNGWAEFTFTAAGTLQFGGNTSIGADTFTWTTGTMEIWPIN